MPAAALAPLLVVLTGPTGSGKSEFALQLVERLAPELTAEIVSVDSAQVYRGMDIGTAKPERAIRERVTHHLIDIREPSEIYSAGDFVSDARAAIAAIHARGALPLLVGGTMLYLRALRDGLAALPSANARVRGEIDAEAAEAGWATLHAQLARIDPAAAARIAPQDAQRIQRALEVHRLTGETISSLQHRTQGTRESYRWLRYALWPDSRVQLRTQLQARFESMLRVGLVDEVKRLYARGDLTPGHPAIRAVGYRQLWEYCEGLVSLELASTAAVNATAHLAKRQLTWLRRDCDICVRHSGEVGVLEGIVAEIIAAVRA
jgi:tRNA dimethylallyltransferase